LEHRGSNPVSVKNLTAIETSIIVKLLRPYVPVGTKRTTRRRRRRRRRRRLYFPHRVLWYNLKTGLFLTASFQYRHFYGRQQNKRLRTERQ
jgi:hypothetical protein